MLKYKILSMLLALSVISIIFLKKDALAVESESDLGDMKYRNIAKVIRPYDAPKDLRNIRKIAVLLTGTSPLFGQSVRDLLTIKLKDIGLETIEQTKLFEASAQELSRLEQQAQQAQGSHEGKILSAIEIGRKLGIDGIIAGSIFEGRRQISFTKDNPPQSIENIVVSMFYLQLIDTRTEKVILTVVLEYDKGASIVNAVDTMTKMLKEEMKR